MWRLLQNPIPDTLRAELETRIGSALAGHRDDGRRTAELELADFFAASRGAGALLRELLNQPDARALIGQRLSDPVVFAAAPAIKQPGAPATPYHSDESDWGNLDPPGSLFTLWFAITDAMVGNGCLRMGSGSAEGERTMVALPRASTLDIGSTSAPAHDASMKAGQVLFYDALQVYGAYPNHSNRPRIAVKALLGERSSSPNRDYREIDDYGSVGMLAKQGWRKLFGGKS
jgi:ectoine hydroxylase-related dioxygenase (phytanoyl-CoA dioxygenase family)